MNKTNDEIRREDALRVHDRSRNYSVATNDAVVKAGEVAIKTVMLINGGAAVSVLAFIGALVRQDGVTVKQVSGVSGNLQPAPLPHPLPGRQKTRFSGHILHFVAPVGQGVGQFPKIA
jgi:hypothetical protein